jgi:hypothetical protein
LRVVAEPRPVYAALRNESEEELEARQEPVLALVLLAGIAGVLATPIAGRLYDEPAIDALFVAVWAFIAGALYLALRSLGGHGTYRRARHVLAFSLVPVILSLALLPVELALYGGDIFDSDGADEGTPKTVFAVLRLGFLLWSAGMLVVGIREVEAWSWQRAAGALGLLALFTAAFLYLPKLL